VCNGRINAKTKPISSQFEDKRRQGNDKDKRNDIDNKDKAITRVKTGRKQCKDTEKAKSRQRQDNDKHIDTATRQNKDKDKTETKILSETRG
jgi:hypothetical protein